MTQIIRTPTSSARKRKKQKPDKATRELMESHAKLLEKWKNVPKWAITKKPPKPIEAPVIPLSAQKPKPKSRTTPGGSTALKPSPKYTGDKVKGIVVQHKSCLQPVFTDEEAIDSAKMRR